MFFIYLILLAMLGVCIWVAVFVYNHYEAFDNEALVYGARKYDIGDCACINNKGNIVAFNQELVTLRENPANKIPEKTYNTSELQGLWNRGLE